MRSKSNISLCCKKQVMYLNRMNIAYLNDERILLIWCLFDLRNREWKEFRLKQLIIDFLAKIVLFSFVALCQIFPFQFS